MRRAEKILRSCRGGQAAFTCFAASAGGGENTQNTAQKRVLRRSKTAKTGSKNVLMAYPSHVMRVTWTSEAYSRIRNVTKPRPSTNGTVRCAKCDQIGRAHV